MSHANQQMTQVLEHINIFLVYSFIYFSTLYKVKGRQNVFLSFKAKGPFVPDVDPIPSSSSLSLSPLSFRKNLT